MKTIVNKQLIKTLRKQTAEMNQRNENKSLRILRTFNALILIKIPEI